MDLLSGSRDTMVRHWDVSWLKSTCDGQKEDVSTQDLTGGLREISRFVGHTVRQLLSLLNVLPVPLLSYPMV